MIPEIGHFALILALLIAAVQAALPIAGAARGDRVWMSVARPAARGQAFFVTFAWLCLVASFVNNDFSVLNVATNSNSQLPLQYKIAASWGSHEGSMLLWVLMLAWWTFAVADLLATPARRDGGARDRRAGIRVDGFPALHADDVGPIRSAVSRRRPTGAI